MPVDHLLVLVLATLVVVVMVPWSEALCYECVPERCFQHDDTINDGDFLSAELLPNDICPVIRSETNGYVSKYAFRMGLPKNLVPTLRKFIDETGVTSEYHRLLLDGDSLGPGRDDQVTLHGDEWFIQRPGQKYKSTMHWISPAGEPAHLKYLQALSEGGFDQVLDAMGNFFGFDGLVCFHLSFIGVDFAQEGFMHYDNTGTGGKVFNMLFPLYLVNEEYPPELDLQSDDGFVGGYKYRYDEAVLIGDDFYHRTAPVDYRERKQIRIAASIYIADVNDDNVKQVLKQNTNEYPPQDSQMLLSIAGSHWNLNNSTSHLPLPVASLQLF